MAEPPLLSAISTVLRALLRGKRAVLAQHEAKGMLAAGPPAREEALCRLNAAITRLREVGDNCDVDTRSLPITWTMDLNWVVPPLTPATCTCIVGCGQTIYQNQMLAHLEAGCESKVGVADPADTAEAGGVQMGGSQAVICDVSAVEIDAENNELLAQEGGTLPWRAGERVHSIDSGINRRPELHAALQFLHEACAKAKEAAVPGAEEAAALLKSYDPHADECWVRDKQHFYWLHRHVRAGRDLGRFDTPASLALRACDAFAERPCFGIPSSELVQDSTLPRRTSRTALPSAAGIKMQKRNGFLWLRYADLGELVRRIASGLLELAPARSLVAISGYNDLEWVVADISIALAGMASVGIHTTYSPTEVVSVLEAVSPALLCASLDLIGPAGSREARWDVSTLLQSSYSGLSTDCDSCKKLLAVVATDASSLMARQCLGLVGGSTSSHKRCGVASFLDFVSLESKTSGTNCTTLPDPFDARGMCFHDSAGNIGDLTTFLFTSGSSGKPKAVAVGVDNFVHDVAGDSSEALAFSEAVTVSYIPLSHSSDRYKVWQHVVYGGRIGLCYFAAANWEAHEKEKKDAMLDYSSPVDALFAQVSALQPTNMACPPNIWGGLEEKFQAACKAGCSRVEAFTKVASAFGGRVKTLATGGSPTPPALRSFAERLASSAGATLVDSYGTTESGAIAADGRSCGAKFAEVEVMLVDRPELGFTCNSKPYPCGEVAVKSPSLCLGYMGGSPSNDEAFLVIDPPERPCPSTITPALGAGRWYLTGDLASRDGTGKLALIDRVGAVVQTKGGSIVRLGELESLFEGLKLVKHCLCHASPEHDTVVAIIACQDVSSADSSRMEKKCQGKFGVRPPSSEDLLQLRRVEAGLEVRFGVADEAWTVANGFLSGELKKRRGLLLQAYAEDIQSLH
eukprot:TRINITY_DN23913_c0_g1_i1.p1 TRINITY_DN23913_c0_g1~~TRINITY_DN23913_c0_g1_i1.p1  ORF type:complete len:968 (-),score=206.74 TRINITY_DN23913_c0_g1_i1:338-3082(-)